MLADEGSLISNREQNPVDGVTFYTITDERFFIGTVAMVNSLRLMGHEQRVVALDCGLSKRQRDLLSSECEQLIRRFSSRMPTFCALKGSL